MLRELGHSPLAQSTIAKFVGDGIDLLVERALGHSTGVQPSASSLAAAMHVFRAQYHDHVFDQSVVYPGVVEGLSALKAFGIPTCCVTNKHSAFTRRLLALSKLDRLLSFALCADRTEDRKPAPNLLIGACEKLSARPDQMLYVGDSHIDVATARAAGCRIAVVSYGYSQGNALEESKPDWTIDRLTDLLALTTDVPRTIGS